MSTLAKRVGETRHAGHGWQSVGLGAVPLLLIVAILYVPTLRGLAVEWWEDPNYSHGFVVPIFSAFLVWQRRRELAGIVPEGSWAGLPLLLVGIVALLLGDIASESYLTRTSLIFVLGGLILFHLGSAVFRVVAFPLLFLFFMVPLPAILFNAVALPLQGLAAQNAAWTLDLLGIPVLLDGNVIHMSQITLGVTEACSGIRSLISLIAVAAALAVLTCRGFWSVAVLMASVFPLTILANAARIVATGLIGERFGVEYAQGFFHTFSGWVVFLVALAGLLAVQSLLLLLQRRRRTSPA